MIASFTDLCRGCGDPIAVGDEINWTPDGGPRCLDCGPEQPDERRGPKSAAEDETGAERTKRQHAESIEARVRELEIECAALRSWANDIASELNHHPPAAPETKENPNG